MASDPFLVMVLSGLRLLLLMLLMLARSCCFVDCCWWWPCAGELVVVMIWCYILTRMRFAHPHRSTSRCTERIVRNVGARVGDIVGDAPQRTAYADITNSAPLQRRCSLRVGPTVL